MYGYLSSNRLSVCFSPDVRNLQSKYRNLTSVQVRKTEEVMVSISIVLRSSPITSKSSSYLASRRFLDSPDADREGDDRFDPTTFCQIVSKSM